MESGGGPKGSEVTANKDVNNIPTEVLEANSATNSQNEGTPKIEVTEEDTEDISGPSEGGSDSSIHKIDDGKEDYKKKIRKATRVFQCTGYPDCNMSFTRSEHLARHKRKHTGERPFKCPHCSKRFSRLDNLRQHNQTIHSQQAWGIRRTRRTKTTNDDTKPDIRRMSPNLAISAPAKTLEGRHAQAKDNPHTPVNPVFHHGVRGFSLLSPPNSHSPDHDSIKHAAVPYNNEILTSSGHKIIINETANSYQSSSFKSNIPQFKPKRRPRPLELSYSTMHEDNSSSYFLAQGNTFHSAPIRLPPVLPGGSVPYTSSIPFTVNSTPLSPLFHQTFRSSPNATNENSLNSPSIAPVFNQCPQLYYVSPNAVSPVIGQLPSIKQLPFPTTFNPIHNSRLVSSDLSVGMSMKLDQGSLSSPYILDKSPKDTDKDSKRSLTALKKTNVDYIASQDDDSTENVTK